MKATEVAKASAVMALGTGLARLLGFLRGMILIYAIGSTTPAGNVFDVANRVPTVLYLLVSGGVLNAIIVPQIIRAGKQDDGGAAYLNRLITMAIVCLAGVTAILTALSPFLVKLYSDHGWSESAFSLAVAFAYWCMPQVFFLGIYAVLGQILNARKSFGPYMWAPVLNNVCGIAALIAFINLYGAKNTNENQHAVSGWSTDMVTLLAGSTTATMALQVLILLPFLRAVGFRYRPAWDFWSLRFDSASRVALWTLGAVVTAQFAYILTSKVCARASAYAESLEASPELADAIASNATYTYAFLVTLLPHSLLVVSLVTALVTRMSHHIADANTLISESASGLKPCDQTADDTKTNQSNPSSIDRNILNEDLSAGLRSITVVTILAAAGLIAFSHPIGLVMTGEPRSGQALANVIVAMTIGLLPFSLNYLLQRVFYTLEDGAHPFWAQVPNLVVMTIGNLIAYIWVTPQYMVIAVGLAMSAGNAVGAGALLICMRKAVAGDWLRSFGRLVWRLIPVGLVLTALFWWLSGLVLAALTSTRLVGLITSLVLGATMVVTYIVLLHLLRVPELHAVLSLIRQQRQIDTKNVPGER